MCAEQRAGRGMSGRSVPTKAPPSAHAVAVPIPRPTWVALYTRRLNKHKPTNSKKKCRIARHLKPLKNKKAKKHKSLQNKRKQSGLPTPPKLQPTPQNQRVRRKRDNKRVGSQKGLHKRPPIQKRRQSNRKRCPHPQIQQQKRLQSNRKRCPHPQIQQPKLASVKQTLLPLYQLSTPISFLP